MRSDGELLRQIATEEADAALTELIQRHGGLVFRVARRMTGDDHSADDVCQAVFIILVRKAKLMRSEGSLASWLYQTTVLVTRDQQRAEGRRKRREDEAARMNVAEQISTEPVAVLPAGFDEALTRLPERYRRAIVVRYLENRSRDDAAREIGVSTGTFDVRTSRALERLRAILARHQKAAGTSAVILSALVSEAAHAAPLAAPKAAELAVICSGKAAASAAVSAAADAAISAMFLTKVKIAALFAFMAFGFLSIAAIAYTNIRAASAPSAVIIPIDLSKGEYKAPMALRNDSAGTQYISSDAENGGYAQYKFSVAKTGTYYIWCRVLAASPNSDSFFVGIDGSKPEIFDFTQDLWSAQWQWRPITLRNAEIPDTPESLRLIPRKLDLDAGEHAVTFQGREVGAKINRLVVTDQAAFKPEQLKQ